jgi:hypothetical protein
MKTHFRKFSLAFVIVLNLSFPLLLPAKISKAMPTGSLTNDSEDYIYSWTRKRYIPVKDVSEEMSKLSKAAPVSRAADRAFRSSKERLIRSNPNLTDKQKKRAIKKIRGGEAPDPVTQDYQVMGMFGLGDYFTPAFQNAFSDVTALSCYILCPTTAGGNNSGDLYLTSSNRATLFAEAFVSYSGQNVFQFLVYDFARPDHWQVNLTYYQLSNYLTTITVNGINYQALELYNSTKIIAVSDPAGYLWKNAVHLFNYSTGYYDSLYHYQYIASMAAQKTGFANWGPIFETFQATYSNLNPMGFYECSMISNSDNYGDLHLYPSKAYFSGPNQGLQLLYLEANHTFTAH